MRKLALFVLAFATLAFTASLHAQQFDVAFGAGTITTPSNVDLSGGYTTENLAGGTYLSFSGDYLFAHNFGFGGDVSWRAKQAVYGGYQPYRPILYDINAVYAPNFGKHFGVEAVGGFGGESLRFYTPYPNCSSFSCTDYVSSNHLMGDIGGGIKFYLPHNLFIRPEFRAYFVRNNFELSSPRVFREGVSIGFSTHNNSD